MRRKCRNNLSILSWTRGEKWTQIRTTYKTCSNAAAWWWWYCVLCSNSTPLIANHYAPPGSVSNLSNLSFPSVLTEKFDSNFEHRHHPGPGPRLDNPSMSHLENLETISSSGRVLRDRFQDSVFHFHSFFVYTTFLIDSYMVKKMNTLVGSDKNLIN